MGKGIIISNSGSGLYQVRLNLHRERLESEIQRITAAISALTNRIAGETDPGKKAVLKLQKVSLGKRLQLLQAHPDDPVMAAWCADLTEDLSGDVGTAEIPGERGDVQVLPAGRAGSGQFQRAIAGTPAGTFFNLAVLPAWQKWKPTFRYGTITAISEDICSVALEDAQSSQQALNINQASTLSGVPIEYMTCNGTAFSEGDDVLVEFEGQDWGSPKVIGFKNEPKPCISEVFVKIKVNGLDSTMLKTFQLVDADNNVYTIPGGSPSYGDYETDSVGVYSIPIDLKLLPTITYIRLGLIRLASDTYFQSASIDDYDYKYRMGIRNKSVESYLGSPRPVPVLVKGGTAVSDWDTIYPYSYFKKVKYIRHETPLTSMPAQIFQDAGGNEREGFVYDFSVKTIRETYTVWGVDVLHLCVKSPTSVESVLHPGKMNRLEYPAEKFNSGNWGDWDWDNHSVPGAYCIVNNYYVQNATGDGMLINAEDTFLLSDENGQNLRWTDKSVFVDAYFAVNQVAVDNSGYEFMIDGEVALNILKEGVTQNVKRLKYELVDIEVARI